VLVNKKTMPFIIQRLMVMPFLILLLQNLQSNLVGTEISTPSESQSSRYSPTSLGINSRVLQEVQMTSIFSEFLLFEFLIIICFFLFF